MAEKKLDGFVSAATINVINFQLLEIDRYIYRSLRSPSCLATRPILPSPSDPYPLPTQVGFFLRFSRIRVNLLSYQSKLTDEQEQYIWITGCASLDQTFFGDPVVLEPICYCTGAKQLINEGNTTRGLNKIWTNCKLIYVYTPTSIYARCRHKVYTW